MIPVLSRAEMRAFDKHAIETCKVPGLLLMENAGRGAADIIERELLGGRATRRRVLVVAGTGNNGGDGFVVARHLLARGAKVEVWLAGSLAKTSTDCRVNHDAFVGVGGSVVEIPLARDLAPFGAALAEVDVVVDALFGTGLNRPLEEPLATVVRLIGEARARGAQVAALDVPSGLDADTGGTLGTAVEADLTATFAHLKLGLVTGQGAQKAGTVHVVDIGVPPLLLADRSADLAEAGDVRMRVNKRAIDAHKYRAGHVVIVAGSQGKVGAALLSATAALRAGAGAATILTWPDAAHAIEGRVPEIMVTRIEDNASVDATLAKKKVVVVGPGFGTDDRARAVSRHILATFQGMIVGDADIFSLHAGAPEAFSVAEGRVILTPHAGELGRLLGRSGDAIEADRFGAARDAAARSKAVVLLKGPYTVVAAPDGRIVVTGSGGPALATAGSGDVLSGLIGALACALSPFDAAWCGAFLHGVVGSAWQKENGDRGLLASEIAGGIPGVIAALFG